MVRTLATCPRPTRAGRHPSGASAVAQPLEPRRLLAATATILGTFTSGSTPSNDPFGTSVADVNGDLYAADGNGDGSSFDSLLAELPAGTHTTRRAGLFQAGPNAPGTSGPLLVTAAGHVVGGTTYVAYDDDPAGGLNFLFNAPGGNGTFGTGLAADAAGNLYAALNGYPAAATLVEYQPATQTATAIATLPNRSTATPDIPLGRPVFDAAGNLYGTVGDFYSGTDAGLVYEVAAGTHAVTVVHAFAADGSEGRQPGGLTMDANGDLFGFAQGGGANHDGSVFELAGPAHTFSVLASLGPATGRAPAVSSEPAVDGAGNLYGTTTYGGPDAGDQGTAFELPAGGHQLVVLAAFARAGHTAASTVPTVASEYPSGGLTLDAAGHLFGATFGDTTTVPAVFYEVDGAVSPLTVTPPPAQFATAGATETFALGSLLAGGGAAGPYTASVDWGDGTAKTTFATAGQLPARTHAYAKVGTDTATVTVTDRAGHTSNPATFAVTVTPKPIASVVGSVDRDTGGNAAAADFVPLAGVTVTLYRDANGNGRLDPADPQVGKVRTAAAGTYAFAALPSGPYLVTQSAVPAGYVRTAPALSDVYAVTVTAGRQVAGGTFADYQLPTGPLVTRAVYAVNGVTVPTLRDHTFHGATVTVTLTAGYDGESFTVVGYNAPSARFSADTAARQTIDFGGFTTYSGVAAGQTVTFTFQVPTAAADPHYQIDVIEGMSITRFGPAGSNLFYTPQGRLIATDNE